MPVSRTSTRPVTTPALVHTSESTCRPSARSVIDRTRVPVATRYQPSTMFTTAAAMTRTSPSSIARTDGPARKSCSACQRMSTAANAIRPPSKTALKYSILP